MLAISDIKMTSIYYSQVKKVISRTECGIEFIENQYGRKIIVYAERGKGESSQATESRWLLGWALKIKPG